MQLKEVHRGIENEFRFDTEREDTSLNVCYSLAAGQFYVEGEWHGIHFKQDLPQLEAPFLIVHYPPADDAADSDSGGWATVRDLADIDVTVPWSIGYLVGSIEQISGEDA